MSDTLETELSELIRLTQTQLEWQRELGLNGLAIDADVLRAAPVAARSRPSSRASTADAPPADAPVEAPAVRFERPSFMATKREPPPRPAPSAKPAASPPTLEPPVATKPEPPAPPATPPADASASKDRAHVLRVLQDEVASCTKCRLSEGRTQTVFARGNPFAEIAFVGEGPGRDEDLQGYPFVGAAGQLLDKIITAMGLTEQDVYICNVVKCRPPNNRVPAPDEMATCGPYLVRQLGAVKPKVIVALGKTAVSYLLQSNESMTRLRGKWQQWEGIPVLPTWHPAYLLRMPSAKKDTWDDMKLVLERVGRAVPKR